MNESRQQRRQKGTEKCYRATRLKNAEKIEPDDAWKGWKGIVKKSTEPESLKGRVETL